MVFKTRENSNSILIYLMEQRFQMVNVLVSFSVDSDMLFVSLDILEVKKKKRKHLVDFVNNCKYLGAGQ